MKLPLRVVPSGHQRPFHLVVVSTDRINMRLDVPTAHRIELVTSSRLNYRRIVTTRLPTADRVSQEAELVPQVKHGRGSLWRPHLVRGHGAERLYLAIEDRGAVVVENEREVDLLRYEQLSYHRSSSCGPCGNSKERVALLALSNGGQSKIVLICESGLSVANPDGKENCRYCTKSLNPPGPLGLGHAQRPPVNPEETVFGGGRRHSRRSCVAARIVALRVT